LIREGILTATENFRAALAVVETGPRHAGQHLRMLDAFTDVDEHRLVGLAGAIWVTCGFR
jgi:hypothetical protein